MKTNKTISEFHQFMWKEYPDENSVKQYKCRVAMQKAYDFLNGIIDQQEQEKKKISDSIFNQLTEYNKKVKRVEWKPLF